MTLCRIIAAAVCFALPLGLPLDAGGASPAAARCPAGLSTGTPPVAAQHIFCGEVRRDGRAVGFHSRPGGVNPATVSGTTTVRPDPRRPGIYNLSRFRITEQGRSGIKSLSTMFPDHCDAPAVVAAIQHAWRTGTKQDRSFSGLSGSFCADGSGKPFRIQGFTGTEGGRIIIVTAYPN